jgi:hypothetical protein
VTIAPASTDRRRLRRSAQISSDRICAMTRFENTVLPWFGLPRSLPDVD